MVGRLDDVISCEVISSVVLTVVGLVPLLGASSYFISVVVCCLKVKFDTSL